MARILVPLEEDPLRMRPSDLPECVGNPALLEALTGWRPEIPFEKTLSDTLEWWRGVVASEAA
jgi:GDP-4-dehydro-6-deoxy-D-mannose reductase